MESRYTSCVETAGAGKIEDGEMSNTLCDIPSCDGSAAVFLTKPKTNMCRYLCFQCFKKIVVAVKNMGITVNIIGAEQMGPGKENGEKK
jgi:hypothetical protein